MPAPTPLSPSDLMPAVELAAAQAASLERHLSAAATHGTTAALWAALVLFGGNRRLVALSERLAARLAPRLEGTLVDRVGATALGAGVWRSAALYLLLFVALVQLWDLPFDVYAGWFRAHRFGTSNQTVATFTAMLLKEAAASTASLVALGVGLFGLARRLPRWWLWLGLVASAALLAAPLLDPMRARLHFEQAPLQGPLRERIDALVAKAGYEVAGVDVEASSLYTKKPDAYFAGVGPNRRIVLNDNLLRNYTEGEILAAVAHELGHVEEREASPWRLWLGAAAAIPLLWALARGLGLAARRGWAGVRSATDPAALPLVFAVLFFASELSLPVRNWLERRGEAEADRYGLALRPEPADVATLFAGLARDSRDDPAPGLFWVALLHGHPRILDRVEAARRFAAERGLPDPKAALLAARDRPRGGP